MYQRTHPSANDTHRGSSYAGYRRSRSRRHIRDQRAQAVCHAGSYAETGGCGGAYSYCSGSSNCLADASGYTYRRAYTRIKNTTRAYRGNRNGNNDAMQDRPAYASSKRILELRRRPSRQAGDRRGRRLQMRTIVNIWRDANADGFFDVGEEHLAAARVRSDRRFSAIFPVTSPPFVPGEGSTESSSANKVNAVDGEGNTIDPALPAFSADDIPTFKLLTATPTPVPSPYFFKTQLVRAFPNLSFRLQTNLLQPDDETDLIFISELSGRILVFQNDQDTKESRVFLDISGQMYSSAEEGLLGLAFDPDYKDNGRFYVYYAARDPKRLVLSRYSVAPNNRMQANADSELVLMEIPDVSGHDGGQLAFGPDSYLYIGVGDGSTGKRSHPNSGNGQDRSTLRGSLLRIDVSGESDGGAYRIPPDNPFVGVAGAREEIWAYGFRNPWRFSFDRETGNLWLGDVGSHLREEINLIQKGRNYGWSIMEGTHCFEPKDCCDVDSIEPPLVEISRKSFCAVTGGYVFRGREIPPLVGAYVYADFCTGQIFAAWYDGYSDPYHQLILDTALNISSFGQDRAGNLYILSGGRGGDEVDSLHPIYRLTLTPRD